MHNRTRMIGAAAAVTTALAAGITTSALASAADAKPGTPARTMSASGKPGSPAGKAGASKAAEERRGHDMMTAAVARELHVSAARVGAALRPLFAAGRAGTSSPAFAAAARSLGVSAQQLNTALVHAKQSVAASMHIKQRPSGAKAAGAQAAGSKAAEERRGHDMMTAAVARELHVSAARVGAALRPLFAAGRAGTSSPAFAAAARSLGVSAQQLNTALVHAKESLAAAGQ